MAIEPIRSTSKLIGILLTSEQPLPIASERRFARREPLPLPVWRGCFGQHDRSVTLARSVHSSDASAVFRFLAYHVADIFLPWRGNHVLTA